MNQFLTRIIEAKKKEVADLKGSKKGRQLELILQEEHAVSKKMEKALSQDGLSVIAEVKRRSPSAGNLASISDPSELAQTYQRAKASAISVLTDGPYFGGSLQDLESIVKNVKTTSVMRKDFIIDPIQLAETRLTGAGVVLLIVTVLQHETAAFLQATRRLGLEALVEVHDEAEIEIAVKAGAAIIGVNNRNLKTFETDLKTAESLISYIPKNVVKVAESGIKTAEDAKRMKAAGYDAILVGEALVKSESPAQWIQSLNV